MRRMKLARLAKPTASDRTDINRLLAQLSAGNTGITTTVLKRIATDSHTEVWIARDGTRIVGMATLIIFPMFSGDAADVEYVVVDEAYRGQGIGKLLMQKLIERARVRKCEDINLTSRPSRTAANALYQKLGFEMRDTNVYRLKLK
jgi:ribosomal protein S18 acetylase RimI-like enzyme